MIPRDPRTFTVPLWPVYREGVLVAAFVSFEVAAAFEDTLEHEADLTIAASWESTPIYGEAADAVTVAACNLGERDPIELARAIERAQADAAKEIDAAFGDLADFPYKADGTTKRGER